MASRIVIFCAALAFARAGLLPAAYSPAAAYISQPTVAVAHAAPVAIHAPAIGTSQQNVLRSYGGNQAISTYSKAVDSAFSSVRKYDTRITNDAVSVYAHATPVAATYSAPAISYAAPAAYATPAISYAAPVTYAHAAPVATYAAAPVVAKAALAYSPAVAVAHTSFTGLGVNYAF
ncbi:hypothetical protein HHI36_020726 [Cryptolaemus montrouzieri]|uniref:Uncharacterized protein n=1 Tax=Cryptolaemus montrouzieri TaxID=559131 RepID=A0ABD2NBY7_9CUCU